MGILFFAGVLVCFFGLLLLPPLRLLLLLLLLHRLLLFLGAFAVLSAPGLVLVRLLLLTSNPKLKAMDSSCALC